MKCGVANVNKLAAALHLSRVAGIVDVAAVGAAAVIGCGGGFGGIESVVGGEGALDAGGHLQGGNVALCVPHRLVAVVVNHNIFYVVLL